MLKKAVKSLLFVVILFASLSSSIYLNSVAVGSNNFPGIVAFDKENILPSDKKVTGPSVALLKKAIVIAKGFFYPS